MNTLIQRPIIRAVTRHFGKIYLLLYLPELLYCPAFFFVDGVTNDTNSMILFPSPEDGMERVKNVTEMVGGAKSRRALKWWRIIARRDPLTESGGVCNRTYNRPEASEPSLLYNGRPLDIVWSMLPGHFRAEEQTR